MSLIYTYKNSPRNNAPYINGINLEDYTYVYGKPQPIKHWRKQLKPVNKDICTQKIGVFHNNDCYGIQNGYQCIQTYKIQSASTILSKKYYNSTKQYLQSKHKTYQQNQTLGTSLGNNKYNITTSDLSNCSVIYKPSNNSFKQQGSVSASLNTMKIRNDSITKNSNSFRNPYGLSGSNFGNYHGGTPTFVKGKNNNCNSCEYIGYVKPNIFPM
jgi:hypothetical protein